MARSKEPAGRKVIHRNKKAFHDYFIEDRVEAGLVLLGTEVKSLRERRVSLKDAYATIENGEAYIMNMHISEWPGASHFNH
jgi:SsrA-binding protein